MEVRRLGCVLALAGVLWGQDFGDVLIEKVATSFAYADGPAWSRENYLLFSDVPMNSLHKLTPGQGLALFTGSSNGAAGNAFDAQNRLYTCESGARRVVRRDKKGNVEVLAERWEGKRLNAPNDIVVRKDGEVYFTDPAFGSQRNNRELDFYGVYHLTRKGTLEVIARPEGRPNGIALPPNGRVLYVANSDERNVRAYDLDRNGTASGERTFIAGIDGVPNGMKTDENGNLFVAANTILIYSPEGHPIGKIPIPEKPSNLAFGDADLKTLYVTAHTSVYRIRLSVRGSSQF